MESAAPFKTKGEWAKADNRAYQKAHAEKWVECTAHMTPGHRHNGALTLEHCKADALKYGSRKEWVRAPGGAYDKAYKNGWLPQCCAHMKSTWRTYGILTLESCMKSAAPFKTVGEWIAARRNDYRRAHSKGWLPQCTAHMKFSRLPNGSWTFEACLADALKYTSRSEWQRASCGAHKAACKNGWLPQCTAHMPCRSQEQAQRAFTHQLRSAAPLDVEIRDGVRGILPSRRAELDMVAYRAGVPFLAVEYCGIPWHSDHPKIGKRGKEYHENRRRQCEAKGIRLIHVWEDEADNPALLDMIEEAIGAFRPVLYAEDCAARDLSADEAVAFYSENHPHGAPAPEAQTFHRGLVHDGEVIAAVSYILHDGVEDWSMVRFAKKIRWRVKGALAALLTFGSIVTEVDMDIFDGSDLKAAGFVRVGAQPRFSRVENGARVENYKGNPPRWFKLWHCATAIYGLAL
jgi:hypothetical protein